MATYRPHPWVQNLNRVWEIATLNWVVMTQPGGGTGGGGDASAANQVTGNASLAAIKLDVDKIPSQGQALAAASTPVVLTAIQQTALTPPAAITGFALEAGHLAAIDTATARIPALGQALAAASVPVILPTATITTLTPPAAIVGFALEAGHLANIDTKTPALGQALAAAAVPVVLTAIQQTALTPPAAITGFALEAGHLATIDTSTAKIPAQGQALAAASLPVVLTALQVTALTPPAAIVGFALDATLTGGTQQTKITDGTNVATVKAASTLPAATDKAVVVTLRESLSTPVTQATGTNLHTVVDSGTLTAVTAITNALPTGTNTLGSVKVTDGTTTVKVTVANAQPASTDGALLVNAIDTFAGTALASASRGVATVNTDIVNYNGKGIRVWQDLTVLGASSVCQFSIQEKDPVSGKFITILASAATGAGINGTGTAKLTVYPGLTAAANSVASDVLPMNIRIVSTVATAASTFSIGFSIIP